MTPQHVHGNGIPASLESVSLSEPSKGERQLVSTSQVILSIPKGARAL